MSEEKKSQPLEWSHLDERGQARMVDVGQKQATPRSAKAVAFLHMQAEVLNALKPASLQSQEPTADTLSSGKGDVLAASRIAGIQAAKETSRLIPLCHPLSLDQVKIDFNFESETLLKITSEVSLTARTGPEMEAITAASVAALTVYDMCKAVDPDMIIQELRLEEKTGGKKGHYRHPKAD